MALIGTLLSLSISSTSDNTVTLSLILAEDVTVTEYTILYSSEVTSSSITVQWGAVPCIHRNGDITGYSVQYGVLGSESTQTMSVSGANVTISNLAPSTKYIVQVAAMNDAGTGEYSDPVTTNTDGMKRDI